MKTPEEIIKESIERHQSCVNEWQEGWPKCIEYPIAIALRDVLAIEKESNPSESITTYERGYKEGYNSALAIVIAIITKALSE
jgi:hypothetical protein